MKVFTLATLVAAAAVVALGLIYHGITCPHHDPWGGFALLSFSALGAGMLRAEVKYVPD